jgi:hypothetical protein
MERCSCSKDARRRVTFDCPSALLSAAIAWCVLTPGLAPAAPTVTGVGRFDFTDSSGSGADELSGIAYAGSGVYRAVSDGQAKLFGLTIGLNSATGAITSAAVDPSPLSLTDSGGGALPAGDREGIALAGGDPLALRPEDRARAVHVRAHRPRRGPATRRHGAPAPNVESGPKSARSTAGSCIRLAAVRRASRRCLRRAA